jgi:hypothetical protein
MFKSNECSHNPDKPSRSYRTVVLTFAILGTVLLFPSGRVYAQDDDCPEVPDETVDVYNANQYYTTSSGESAQYWNRLEWCRWYWIGGYDYVGDEKLLVFVYPVTAYTSSLSQSECTTRTWEFEVWSLYHNPPQWVLVDSGSSTGTWNGYWCTAIGNVEAATTNVGSSFSAVFRQSRNSSPYATGPAAMVALDY